MSDTSLNIRRLDLPVLDWRNHWLTSIEYARVMNRSVRTIRHWCETGMLIDMNIPHLRDRHGRWWIKNIP